jgi:hypothetical protein
MVDDKILEDHDTQPAADHVEQLARSEQERRPARSPETFVSDREPLVD